MRNKKTENQWQDKTAAWIAGKIITGLLFISCRLQKQLQRLTIKQKKASLLIFCLVGGAYFLFLFGSALFCQPVSHPLHGITPVQENAHPPPDTSSSDKGIKIFKHLQKQKQ